MIIHSFLLFNFTIKDNESKNMEQTIISIPFSAFERLLIARDYCANLQSSSKKKKIKTIKNFTREKLIICAANKNVYIFCPL